MKKSLVRVMAGLVMATTMEASAGSDPVLVDKEAGTISRIIRNPKGEQYPNSNTPNREMLSCKFAYIAITSGHGEALHTINLLESIPASTTANHLILKRVETARAECRKYGLEAQF